MGGFGSTSTDVPRQSNAFTWQGASDGLNNMQNTLSNLMSNIGKSTSPSVNSTPNSSIDFKNPNYSTGGYDPSAMAKLADQQSYQGTVNRNQSSTRDTSGGSGMISDADMANYMGLNMDSIGSTIPTTNATNAVNTSIPGSSIAGTAGIDMDSIMNGTSNGGLAFNAVTGDYDSGVGGIDFSNVTPSNEGGMWNFLSSGDGLNGFMDNAGSAIDIGTSLYGAWNGMKTADLAQDAFDFTKASTNRNIANTAQSLNTSLEDRQNARVASNPNAYTGTSTYMAKNKLDGSAIG